MDLAAVVDDLAIRRVLAEYCHLVDDGRFDDLVELFTPDATFTFGAVGATGRAELRAWFAETQTPRLRGKHLTTNVVAEVAGDTAEARSDFAFLGFRAGRLVPVFAGRYTDRLVRSGDRWLIARRDAVRVVAPT